MVFGAHGRPLPNGNLAGRLILSSPTGLPLQLHQVTPDSRVRRVFPETSRGRARPFKRFCLPLTHSPHSDRSNPPRRFQCAANGHLQISFSVAVGRHIRPSPPTTCSFITCVIRDTFGSLPQPTGHRTSHFSVQYIGPRRLPHPEQGRQRLSFMVNDVAPSRSSRHPNTGMSSRLQPSASSIIFLSRMRTSTRCTALGSQFCSTVRSGYTLHFGRNPPCFDRVHLTVVSSASKASVLQQELSSLLLKGAIEEIPHSDLEWGFFSRYFLVLNRDSGLRPILDLRHLNLSLYKGKFKMLTLKTIMSQIRVGDWFVTVDLKDAYFHIQVIRRHRKFLRFTFGGKAYQYKVYKADLEAVGMAPPGPQVLTSSLPAEVQETIASARVPFTRKLYSSKWKVFLSLGV